MLKFIKHHMTSIDGIEVYPLISFVIFFLFFVVVGTLVYLTPKQHIERMSNLPLEAENQE